MVSNVRLRDFQSSMFGGDAKPRGVADDVSQIVTQDGMYSVRVSSRARDRVAYNSRDAKRNRPRLVVTLGG